MQVVPAFVPGVPNVSPTTWGCVCAVDKAKTSCVPSVPTFFMYPPSLQRFFSCGAHTLPHAQRRSSYGEGMPLKVGDTGDRGVLGRKTRTNRPYFRLHLSLAERGHGGGTLSSLGDMQRIEILGGNV